MICKMASKYEINDTFHIVGSSDEFALEHRNDPPKNHKLPFLELKKSLSDRKF